MKKLAIVLFALTVFACKEKNVDELIPADPESYVVAFRNNEGWNGKAEMYLNKATDTLTILGIIDEENNNRQLLGMKVKLDGAGKYTLKQGQVYFYSIFAGDIIASEYRLSPNEIGELEILKYDTTSNIAEGVFKLKIERNANNSGSAPKTYKFSSGKFKGKILPE